ncbi:cytochrome P450 [Neofusicoccum parvum]|nr:cytochrome P450 [Neofusicoccum parvum]
MQNKTPKRYRWTRQVYSTGFGEASVVSTTDHDLHRLRRKPLEPFFIVAQMRKIQGLIYDKADLLCKRMKEAAADEEPVKIKLAYSCYTTDVISMYLLGVCFDFLDHPGFNREFSDTVTQLAKATPILRPFWWLTSVMEYVPPALHRYLGPGIRAVLAQREETKHHLVHAKARKLAKEKSATPPTETTSPTDSPTIIDALLTSSLPPSEKSDFRLRMEIEILLAAGTETTATCLGALTVFVLDDPDVHAKLTKELVDAIPDASKLPPLQILEKLPYLTGVIREGLRLGFGIYTRITRMAEEPLPYGPYAIPPLTPVSMTSGLTHVDPAIWDQPARFMPERWADPAEAARLGRYLTAFSKGGRACLGINLAYAEMYVAVAAVFRRFGRMELCGFGKEDVEEVVADWNLPKFRKTLNELSVYIK